MTHTTHRMHENSIESWQVYKAKIAGTRAEVVLDTYRVKGSLTDREVRDLLGFQEMNSVRPSITHLLDIGYLIESGKTKCDTTGNTVRLCRAVRGQIKPRECCQSSCEREIEQERDRYLQALMDIRNHMEHIVAPGMYKRSSIWNLANNAIEGASDE